MSAGTGVAHSEFNPSRSDGLHFPQIWIMPDERGLQPSYTEWKPTPAQAEQADVAVISPDGRAGSARIHQDAIVRRLRPGDGLSSDDAGAFSIGSNANAEALLFDLGPFPTR